jgi:hypothetical protein
MGILGKAPLMGLQKDDAATPPLPDNSTLQKSRWIVPSK